MIMNHNQPDFGFNTLIEIQVDGTLIGALERNQQKVTIFFWQGWLIEIQCQLLHHQWTPAFWGIIRLLLSRGRP